MTYLDDVREQAALVCAVAASSGTISDDSSQNYLMLGFELDVSLEAAMLAANAWGEAMQRNLNATRVWSWTREVDAEAEAMLRCGWCPGDK